MQAGFRQLVQQIDFEDSDVQGTFKDYPCHIYMICSRPKIRIANQGLAINKETYKITFEKHYFNHVEQETYVHKNIHNFYSYELNNSGSRIIVKDKNGNIITDGKSSLLYPFSIPEYDDVLDLKVLYVGQAFGENGKRLVSDRLISHSTLQKIYADALENNPTDDIWIIMWQFKPYYISLMGAGIINPVIDLEQSIDNYYKVMDSDIPFDQQITITEAALIKYFSPIYNKEYKTTFPDKSHSSYEICYSLDFNSASFELDTNSIVTRLYSDTVAPELIHIGKFFLHNNEERRDMFKIFDEME